MLHEHSNAPVMLSPTEDQPVLAIRSCPLCGSGDRRFAIGSWRDPLAIARCRDCQLVYATGRVEDGRPLATPVGPASSSTRARKRKALRRYDRLLGGRLAATWPGARALDIGCGTGAMLDELRQLGFTTEGIECLPAAAAIARRRHRVYDVDVAAPGLHLGRTFDLITMFHVLEHVPRPVAALRFARQHLAPGGVLIVEVPNWNDVARPLWGSRYRPLALGEHVAFYDGPTLRRALEAVELRPLLTWSRPEMATLVLPTVRTAGDAARGLLRRLRPTRRTPVAPGAAAPKALPAPALVRHAAHRALDALDPWLSRLVGPHAAYGANVICIASNPPERTH